MKEIKFWRYYVPNIDGEGWGIFLLDSTGMFAAVTDYGNCAYRWTHHGEEDFRKFLQSGSWGYYLSKLFPHEYEYDQDGTLEAIKQRILRRRFERYMDEDQAREEWDLLEKYDNLYSSADFTRWYDETSLVDAEEYYRQDYSASAKAFCYKLLPRLSEMIEKELESEKTAEKSRVG